MESERRRWKLNNALIQSPAPLCKILLLLCIANLWSFFVPKKIHHDQAYPWRANPCKSGRHCDPVLGPWRAWCVDFASFHREFLRQSERIASRSCESCWYMFAKGLNATGKMMKIIWDRRWCWWSLCGRVVTDESRWNGHRGCHHQYWDCDCHPNSHHSNPDQPSYVGQSWRSIQSGKGFKSHSATYHTLHCICLCCFQKSFRHLR